MADEIQVPDFLRAAMDAAGVDVDAVAIAAEQVDLDAIERDEILADAVKRKAAADAKPEQTPEGQQVEMALGPEADALDQTARSELAEQPDLLRDVDAPRVGHWNHPDSGAPDTQRLAALLVHPDSGTQRRRVLDAIALCRDDGATDEELEQILGMRHQTASARRNELAADGWIVDSGRRRPTATGAMAAVWILTERGRAQWRAAAS